MVESSHTTLNTEVTSADDDLARIGVGRSNALEQTLNVVYTY